MPLSPFRARLVLLGFMAVAGGVALNVLTQQSQSAPPAGVRARPERAGLAMDTERLRRLALEAAGSNGSMPPAVSPGPAVAPAVINPRAATPEGRSGGAAHRVGRFAPSSGALAMTALPGVDAAEGRRATVRAVQAELMRRGYEPGTPDGTTGLVTRAAVLAYEHDQGLPLTADPSPEVLAHLRHGTSAPGVAIGLDGEARPPAGHAESVIRSVQQSLRSLGYFGATPDGQAGDDTVRAIREFEMDTGLVPTGRISAPLVSRLVRQLNGRQSG